MEYDLYIKELEDAIFNGKSKKLQEIENMVKETFNSGKWVNIISGDQKDDLSFEHLENFAEYQARCKLIRGAKFWKR
ncbi:hypothetical protein [Aquirufa aurantiipilula]